MRAALYARCLIAPHRSSSFRFFSRMPFFASWRLCRFRVVSAVGADAAAAQWCPVGDLTMSPNAVWSPQRAYRDGPDHVPAGTPLPPGRAEPVIWPLRRHAAFARAGSAQNAAPFAHIACKMTASLRATATTAVLCPFFAFSVRPQRFRALSDRARVSTVLAAS